MNHDKLIPIVRLPQNLKRFVQPGLKSGVLDERSETFEGTPKRGVISPLLCNIALHRTEDLWHERCIDDTTIWLKIWQII